MMDTFRPRGCMGQVYVKSLPQLQHPVDNRGDDWALAVEETWWGVGRLYDGRLFVQI